MRTREDRFREEGETAEKIGEGTNEFKKLGRNENKHVDGKIENNSVKVKFICGVQTTVETENICSRWFHARTTETWNLF